MHGEAELTHHLPTGLLLVCMTAVSGITFILSWCMHIQLFKEKHNNITLLLSKSKRET